MRSYLDLGNRIANTDIEITDGKSIRQRQRQAEQRYREYDQRQKSGRVRLMRQASWKRAGRLPLGLISAGDATRCIAPAAAATISNVGQLAAVVPTGRCRRRPDL